MKTLKKRIADLSNLQIVTPAFCNQKAYNTHAAVGQHSYARELEFEVI